MPKVLNLSKEQRFFGLFNRDTLEYLKVSVTGSLTVDKEKVSVWNSTKAASVWIEKATEKYPGIWVIVVVWVRAEAAF